MQEKETDAPMFYNKPSVGYVEHWWVGRQVDIVMLKRLSLLLLTKPAAAPEEHTHKSALV